MKNQNDCVAVVILNWNNASDTIRALKSIFYNNYYCYYVVLVDNASTDKSIDQIKKWAEKTGIRTFIYHENVLYGNPHSISLSPYNKSIYIIINKKNYCYSGGMNRGIIFSLKYLKPTYILLLNNDIIIDNKLISILTRVLASSNNAAIVGPKVLEYYSKNIIPIYQPIFNVLFPGLLSKFFKNIYIKEYKKFTVYDVNRLDGSCYLIKTSILKQVGLFDPKFYCYWEDTDFFYRVRKKGYLILNTNKTFVRHKVGAFKRGFIRLNSFAWYLIGRNGVHFIRKHYYGPVRYLQLFFYTLNSLIFSLFLLINPFNMVTAYYHLLGVFRGLLGEVGEPRIRRK